MIKPQYRVRNPALLIVDMQNDFVRTGAALEVSDAPATIPVNRYSEGITSPRAMRSTH